MTDEQPGKRPRDERQVNAEIEVHTPSWLPGAKIALGYKRLWDKRVEQFVEATAETAGIRPDSLAAAVEDNDAIQDVFVRAANRIKERSDGMYIDVLSRLVGAALVDETKVDEIGFIVDRLIKLDPVHIRIISLFPYRSAREAVAAGNPVARRFKENNQRDWDAWERWEDELLSAIEGIHELHPANSRAMKWLRSERIQEAIVHPDNVYRGWLNAIRKPFPALDAETENGRLEGYRADTFFSIARRGDNFRAMDEPGRKEGPLIHVRTYVGILGISKPVLDALLAEIAAVHMVEQLEDKGWKTTDLGKTAAYLLVDALRGRRI